MQNILKGISDIKIRMKIVYITDSLVRYGGTEKILTEKANYLSERFGYDITIISCTQPHDQPNAFPLSSHVKQINLNYPYYKPYRYGYPKRLWMKIKADKELRKILTENVIQLNPDILIGLVCFKADIISKIKCRAKKIIECHEARYYSLADTEHNRSFFSRIYMDFYKRNHYFKTIEKNADVVVTLTNGDKYLWKRAKHVEVIPNFSNIEISRLCNINNKRIISVGRLSPEKGYGRLMEIWKIVSVQHPDWQLDIYGEGKMRESIKSTIIKQRINNICLHHATSQISQEYAKSSVCVMTSYYEGFGLTLLEALKHGVPCIAFDCPFGPGSIIEDNRCGFLIEDGNIHQYAIQLCKLIEDEQIRKDFSIAAIKREKAFSVDTVMNQWEKLFLNISSN